MAMCLIFGMASLLLRWFGSVECACPGRVRQRGPICQDNPLRRHPLASGGEPGDKVRHAFHQPDAPGGPPMNLLSPVDRYFSVKGLRLHVLDWGGEGRTPLLLLHGFTGHAHAWDTLSIALQPHFHVYAMDQRGHGDSDPAEVYNAIASFDDIGGVIDQLGLTSLVVIGLSMGGRNAIYFASKRPTAVQKLVIVDIGPEISKRAALAPAGPPEPATWESIEQAAQHLYRGNPYPGIHYYRWVAASSLRQGAGGAPGWEGA